MGNDLVPKDLRKWKPKPGVIAGLLFGAGDFASWNSNKRREFWNQFSRKRSKARKKIYIDLRKGALKHADFSQLEGQWDFSYCIFSHHHTFPAEMVGWYFDSSKLDKCHLGEVRFLECRMVAVSLKEAYLEKAIFIDCNINHANFESADLKGATFSNLGLGFAKALNFRGADLKGVTFQGSNLFCPDFRDLRSRGTNLLKVSFRDVMIESGNFKGCNIIASQIFDVTFTRVNFNNTVFDECRFLRVVFESCNMVKAYMGTRWGNKDFPKQDKFYLNN